MILSHLAIPWMQTTLSLLPSTHAAFVGRLVNDSYQPLVPHHTRRASGLLIHHLCILPAELIAFRERSSCAACSRSRTSCPDGTLSHMQTTQYVDPRVDGMLRMLRDEFRWIRLAAYRAGCKLRALQHFSSMSLIRSLSSAVSSFPWSCSLCRHLTSHHTASH